MSQTRITIRPLRLNDVEDIYEIMHMPNVLWGTSQLPSKTLEAWRQSIERWMNDEHVHVFVADIGGKAVGAIHLKVGEGRERHVGTITMAVHDMYQGQSIGKMLMITVIDLADNWLNLLRLELEVFTDNERAINLYKRFDFEVEGRKRCDGYRAGVYIDSFVMARLRPQHAQTSPGYADTLTQAPPIEPADPQGSRPGSSSGVFLSSGLSEASRASGVGPMHKEPAGSHFKAPQEPAQ